METFKPNVRETYYKLVYREPDGRLTSVIAKNTWTVTYTPGEVVYTRYPMFAFTAPTAAVEFIAANFDGLAELYELWECTAEEVQPLPGVLPYGDEIDQPLWELYWKDVYEWGLTMPRQNYNTQAFKGVLVNGVTLTRNVSKEYV